MAYWIHCGEGCEFTVPLPDDDEDNAGTEHAVLVMRNHVCGTLSDVDVPLLAMSPNDREN